MTASEATGLISPTLGGIDFCEHSREKGDGKTRNRTQRDARHLRSHEEIGKRAHLGRGISSCICNLEIRRCQRESDSLPKTQRL